MAGLLDMLNSEDGLLLGLSLMAAGSPKPQRTGFGEGLLGAFQNVQQAKTAREDRAFKQQYQQAQMADFQAQAQQRAAAAQAAQQQAARAAAFQQALGGSAIGPQQAMAGGGGPTMANAAQIGQQQAPDFRALALRFPEQAKLLEQLAGAKDWGRQEVARTMATRDAGGMPGNVMFDKYGGQVGGFIPEAVKMQLENMGGHSVAVNPYGLQAGETMRRTQSPDSAASNALGWANYGLSKQRLALDQQQPKGQYDAERGLMIDPRTGQATPVTQGGQPIGAKNKDMTDSQAKALLFGERMKAADKILGEASQQGVNMPGVIRSAGNAVPGWLGAAPRAIGNYTQSQQEGNVEQAQRDFINAVLRRESGAVISPQEFENARQQYFYAPGDGPENIRQKAEARRRATDLMLREVPSQHRGGAGGGQSLDDLLKKYGG